MQNEQLPPSNLTFLIDVSGSMQSPDKLPLLKQAFHLLVNQLTARDRVAIVAYAGSEGVVLGSTPGSEKQKIHDAIDALEARLGANWSAIRGARTKTEEIVARLGEVLSDFDDANFSIVVTGSLGPDAR